MLVATLPIAGCPKSQSTLAALTNTLGNAAATLAAIEGNSALAAKLQTDTAAAVAAIQNWKQGTPTQTVIQVINLVIDDLDLICPAGACGPYQPLIVLALGTAQSIILMIDPNAAAAGTRNSVRRVKLSAPAPKTSDEFKARWNKLCSENPQLAKAALK